MRLLIGLLINSVSLSPPFVFIEKIIILVLSYDKHKCKMHLLHICKLDIQYICFILIYMNLIILTS